MHFVDNKLHGVRGVRGGQKHFLYIEKKEGNNNKMKKINQNGHNAVWLNRSKLFRGENAPAQCTFLL